MKVSSNCCAGCGSFTPSFCKTHPRQWVDYTDPFYNHTFCTVNPTNGSWWIVQICILHNQEI
jgi:hypothetical protein